MPHYLVPFLSSPARARLYLYLLVALVLLVVPLLRTLPRRPYLVALLARCPTLFCMHARALCEEDERAVASPRTCESVSVGRGPSACEFEQQLCPSSMRLSLGPRASLLTKSRRSCSQERSCTDQAGREGNGRRKERGRGGGTAQADDGRRGTGCGGREREREREREGRGTRRGIRAREGQRGREEGRDERGGYSSSDCLPRFFGGPRFEALGFSSCERTRTWISVQLERRGRARRGRRRTSDSDSALATFFLGTARFFLGFSSSCGQRG